MRLIYILSFLIYSSNILANDVSIDKIGKNKFNSITQELCIGIDKEKLAHYQKMACLEILQKGVKEDNFYSIYLLHKALKSKVNFGQKSGTVTERNWTLVFMFIGTAQCGSIIKSLRIIKTWG